MNINEYMESLRQAKMSPATIEAYQRELNRFRDFMKGNRLRITQIKPSVILQYMKEMDQAHPSKGEAVRRRLAVLSTFFASVELASDGRIRNPVTPLRRPRRQKPNPKPVEDEILEALLNGITDARDKAIVMMFASTGLRLSELVSLNRDSIHVEVERRGDLVKVLGVGRVIGKGSREREFYTDLPTLRQLHAYEQQRGSDDIEALFTSNRKRRMTQRAIQHMLWKWCDQLRLTRIHPHALRHTASTTWHRLGMDTLKISNLLGHASVATTQLYIRPDTARLRAEYFASMEMLASRTEHQESTSTAQKSLP